MQKRAILITGASKGIGRAVAVGLARKDTLIFAAARRQAELEETCRTVGAKGGRAIPVPFDLGEAASIDALTSRIQKEADRLDVVVHCAFGYLEVPLPDCKAKEIYDFFGASVAGTLNLTRAVLPLLAKSSRPQIVNVVADWGIPLHNVSTGPSAYVAAKYAINGFGVAVQKELSDLCVGVTNIHPGIVASDMDLSDPAEAVSSKYGNNAIALQDVVDAVEFSIQRTHAFVRHIVLSPPNPEYTGL